MAEAGGSPVIAAVMEGGGGGGGDGATAITAGCGTAEAAGGVADRGGVVAFGAQPIAVAKAIESRCATEKTRGWLMGYTFVGVKTGDACWSAGDETSRSRQCFEALRREAIGREDPS